MRADLQVRDSEKKDKKDTSHCVLYQLQITSFKKRKVAQTHMSQTTRKPGGEEWSWGRNFGWHLNRNKTVIVEKENDIGQRRHMVSMGRFVRRDEDTEQQTSPATFIGTFNTCFLLPLCLLFVSLLLLYTVLCHFESILVMTEKHQRALQRSKGKHDHTWAWSLHSGCSNENLLTLHCRFLLVLYPSLPVHDHVIN